MNVGDGCATMQLYLMPLNYTFKNDKNGELCYVSYHNFKNC